MASGNKAAVDDFFRRYLMPTASDGSENSSKIDELQSVSREPTDGPSQQDVERLASQLQRLGYYGTLPMVLLQAGDNFEDSSDGTRVYDVIQFLIQKLSKVQGPGAGFSSALETDIDLASKCERLQADYDHLLHVRQSLMSEVKMARQDNSSLQSRIGVIEDNFASSSSAWSRERDLLQKQVAGLKQRDIQYQHDIRRLEREGEQLRTKLRQMLATKDKIARVAIPVASSSDENSMGGTSSSFGQIETYKSMISRYDDQQRSLLAENEQLRNMLAIVTQQLREWGDLASTADLHLGAPVQPLSPEAPESKAEVFNGDVKALFERLKIKAEAGIQAKAHIGEMKKMLKDQDNLLRLALGISPQVADYVSSKSAEKPSDGTSESSQAN